MDLLTGSRLALLIICILCSTSINSFSAYLPKMRPYTGIGVLIFSESNHFRPQELLIPLYNEPGLSRFDTLKSTKLHGNEWVFGIEEATPPLIVAARKGDWLQIYYDDAGRKAWVKPRQNEDFLSWEQFLKLQTSRMLPGLQAPFYLLQQEPGGEATAKLTPKQIFKVLKLEKDWSMVLTEQGEIGWLKWRDVDGRLTMGIGKL